MSAPGEGRVRSWWLRQWCSHAALPTAAPGERATCPRCKQECVVVRRLSDHEHHPYFIEWCVAKIAPARNDR